MTLIDTSGWIDLLRRNGDPTTKKGVSILIETGQAAYCGPVEFELLSGARPKELPDLRAALSFGTRLDFSQACWHRAAEFEQTLRKRGVTVPRDDIFVAAAASVHDVPLYARDPHFAMMRDRGQLRITLA
jgi:predicted nucleic acid-binding protein